MRLHSISLLTFASRIEKKKVLVGFFYLFVSFGRLYAAGSTAAEFLNLCAGARQTAMGNALGAVEDDIAGVYFNPAGLPTIKHPQISLNHTEGLTDTRCEFLGLVYPNKKIGTFALGLFYTSYGEMIGRTADGHRSSDFTASDIMYAASYGNKLDENVHFGINVKLINQEIAGIKAETLAFDFGALYAIKAYNLKLAIIRQNMGKGVRFVKDESPLPAKTVLGLAYQPKAMPVVISCDLNMSDREDIRVSMGAEYIFGDIFAARLGMNSASGGNFSLSYGFGFRMKNYGLDYAFIPFGLLGDVHRLSLSIKIGGK